MGSKVTLDANEAVAKVAYLASEVVAIYPITPSSPMGEWADQWASEEAPNLWDTVPTIVEMQSEAGVAGAIHGALQAGALATTFTASQGLLLMIPNMYKIAGELTPAVIHVAARTVATHALSIFGDHSDVMAARQTGFALLASNSVQEAMDMALIAHAATLEARIPFLHFFDGFRTSHEVAKIDPVGENEVRAMINQDLVRAHRERALSPDRPFIRGTAQNPDVFFQAREACNPFYNACPTIVENAMDQFAALTGRRYHLFDYVGAEDAERVIVMMGSGAEAAEEALEVLTAAGEKVGLLKVHLYRPFSIEHFLNALPATVKSIAVLDRTKEPGAVGEPLYIDVVTALHESAATGNSPFQQMPRVVGGRYGLSSKEFTPAMVKAVYDNLSAETPRNHFTVGIKDDVTFTSLDVDTSFTTVDPKTVRAIFYGLGSDGTVGANKNSIKIIGEETDFYTQGYFVYDSKKSGSITTSHLRFGPRPIRSTYLIDRASFVACHQFTFIDRIDVLSKADKGATFLLNAPYGPDEVWDHLPATVQKQIIAKELKLYVIDAYAVAHETGMGRRINTVMQTCFFAISGVLPREEAITKIKQAIKKTYGKRGQAVVDKNFAAVDQTLANLHQIKVPATANGTVKMRPPVPADAPEFVRSVIGKITLGEGDDLPVSALPIDGTFPSATTKWEKRTISLEAPVWDPEVCIQCGKCVMVCPHAVIRGKLYEPAAACGAPETFKSTKAKTPDFKDHLYTIQVSPEDCTGCNLCVEACPAKNKREAGRKAINMEPVEATLETERLNWEFFLNLPEMDRTKVDRTRVKDLQLLEPLFEFSGACAGCGETPYVKLLSQLFGDRAMIANATGCTSIYGGNLPTTPWAVDKCGRGPAWSNSLFEDNAEFGFGMRVTIDKQIEFASELLKKLESEVGSALVSEILEAAQRDEEGIAAQRLRIVELKKKLTQLSSNEAKLLLPIADILVRKSVWILGGDGWAYDIGYGGLDHVLASNRNVNILVLDTEVYSNTGGQQSKATPRAAVAKFAAAGKGAAKKDLALLAMTYGTAYVARIAMGANDAHTAKAFVEAEAWDGPSLILAYAHCIAHGFDLSHGLEQQKNAVASGHWPLFRFNPARAAEGLNPMQLDSRAPKLPLEKYAYNETRYSMLTHSKPEAARALMDQAQNDVGQRWRLYEHLSTMPLASGETGPSNT
ncbi:MAG: pyruvate-ferredoxin/flavodoxin oxidoreductase [Candidatus Sumerlaeota bacterium]|nr:pyruvate-ferredoxin/flavodoxin oxidoreductase [Candidatus Sumerlaeota bacterium]